MAKVFLALALVLFLDSLGVILCSDLGQAFGQPEGGLSRSKRSLAGHSLCPCPGTHGPQKQRHHRWACPCDNVHLPAPEQPHHLHHPHHPHGGKAKRHLHRKKKQCQRFLRHCHLRQVNIPL